MLTELPHFSAAIFDFDGVIIDSESIHAAAKQDALTAYDVEYPPTLFDDFKGRTDLAFFEHVVNVLKPGLDLQTVQAVKKRAYADRSSQLPLVPDAKAFLRAVKSRYGKVGLATSATRKDFTIGADLHQLQPYFDQIVTGDDTSAHKPDPAPFLKARELLGVSETPVMVVEDAPNGVRSAKAAGCFVVGLTTSFTAQTLHEAGADLVVATYRELCDLLGWTLDA